MAGLPKKYFKMHPGNLKRAWAAYKADKGSGNRGAPKRKSGKKTRTNGGEVMATKKKRGHKRAAVKRAAGKVYRRARAGMDTKPGKVIMAAGIAAAGGVATSFAINKIPKVKDMSQGMKSGIQIAAGVAAIFFGKKKWIKALGGGSVVAVVMGAVKTMTGINPLAGPSAGGSTLPAYQMRKLIQSGGMNAPMSSVRMGAPVNTMRGGKGFGGIST